MSIFTSSMIPCSSMSKRPQGIFQAVIRWTFFLLLPFSMQAATQQHLPFWRETNNFGKKMRTHKLLGFNYFPPCAVLMLVGKLSSLFENDVKWKMWHIAHIYALTLKANLGLKMVLLCILQETAAMLLQPPSITFCHIAASQWISRPAMKLGFCFDRLCPVVQKQKFNLQNLRCIFLCLAF